MSNVKAPFSPEQVCSIQAWQDNPMTHEMTCGTENCGGEGHGSTLIVDANGLWCEHCGYKQDWVPSVVAGDS